MDPYFFPLLKQLAHCQKGFTYLKVETAFLGPTFEDSHAAGRDAWRRCEVFPPVDQPGIFTGADLSFSRWFWAPDALLHLSPYQTNPFHAYAEKLAGTPTGIRA